MRAFLLLMCVGSLFQAAAQNATVSGSLVDQNGEPVEFANVVLYNVDSTLVKIETTDESGAFTIANVKNGDYFLKSTCIGYAEFVIPELKVIEGQDMVLGSLQMQISAVELETAVVSATRALVEIKADRTVFNVQGTINSTGDNALSLLRKAPGILVDNNNNISVLSRSGVLIYVDGKRLPLAGDNLTNYLEHLAADQIDRIDIISSPGARYEAEGNAGIIDIRLKKDTNHGANGSISATGTKAYREQGSMNANGNYRNAQFNTFGGLGYYNGTRMEELDFNTFRDLIHEEEEIDVANHSRDVSYRWGTDVFIGEQHTVGFLISGGDRAGNDSAVDRIKIGSTQRENFDSVLVATNSSTGTRRYNTYNLNYRYQLKGTVFNVDADYGRYRNAVNHIQPNQYFDPAEQTLLSEVNTAYETPSDIDIYTFKVDYEKEIFGGTFGAGGKLSKVRSDNTFLFYDIPATERVLNQRRSNQFIYDENVYAGYLSFARPVNEKWNLSLGLRVEKTDAQGDLQAFLPELQEPPVKLNPLNAFPTLGVSYQFKPDHGFSVNYGRRINRPDYNVLNPFREQISELSFSKGNPFLRPEIVNNVELGYTLKYRYNFKIAYSHTIDQITRLIGPDDVDPRAGFITWDNLATQTIYAVNMSLPFEVNSWWNAYINLSGSHTDNRADYGENAVVDVQAWSYNMYQQHAFNLPGKFKGEISGWYSGPGVWGGVFLYDASWSLNLGLQRRFLKDQMQVRLTVNDIFDQAGWSGISSFNGLSFIGSGNGDSRRASLSISMNLGNDKVKSRNRKTGLESEARRVGEDQ